MHSSDEHLSSASYKQRQSLPVGPTFATTYQSNAEETKSNEKLKESSSDEDEDNSTVDNFDTNYGNFRPQHLSIDYNAGHLSPSYGQSSQQQPPPQTQQTPSSNKKGRSLSIASVLSSLSPSNSAVNKHVPQFLTVSPTYTPRARPPPAYVGNFAGAGAYKPSIAPPSTSPRMDPTLGLGGEVPNFEAARGGTLGSATSQLLSSRSRHQSIEVKVSTGSNQVLHSHLARKRQSVVSALVLETLANANANYSRRPLMRGQTCYGSASGPSSRYFSPNRFTEHLKESYDEEQNEQNLKPQHSDAEGERKPVSDKKISIEAPTIEQRASILTTATTRTFTSEEKENQIDEELLSSSKMEDAPIDDGQVKISIDASDKLSQIKEFDDQDEKMEPEAPTFSLGERIVWVKTSGPEYGTIKWIGRMPKISSKWTIGVEFDNAIGNCDGNLDGKRYFQAKENYHAKFLPLSSVTKLEAYLTRPRSGTLLSRMSVQMKPGQLISVQRIPSINHIPVHCALTAPHHIDHDVHETNLLHCLCNNCNHPCAHLCHTKNVKGSKKKQRAHMCHFSQKPHNKLCCGGEDLRHLIASGKLEKVGGLLQEVKEQQIAVAVTKAERMQALKQKTSQQRSSSGSRVSTIGGHAVGSVGSAAIGAGFNTIVVSGKQQRKSGQYSLTPEPPSPPAISPLPSKDGINRDSLTLDRDSRRRKADRSSVGSRRLPSSSAPSSVERVSVCSLSSCSKKDPTKHNLIENEEKQKEAEKEKEDEPKLNGKLERSGSELSISSLPSTTSPVEVYIARGALTDESEYESDLENNKQLNLANNINLDKSSHISSHVNSQIGSRISSKHSQATNNYYNQNALSHTNIYQPHHRSTIRSMFACLVGRQPHQQYPPNLSNSKENYVGSSYYYDAGLDGCVRRKKTKKSKKKSSKKKRSCGGNNKYCYYCTSHNNYQTSSQAPSRTSNQSTIATMHTAGSTRHSTGQNSQNLQNSNNVILENASITSARNNNSNNLSNQLVDNSNRNNKSYHLNVKNSCGLSPSPEPDSQQALLSNYSDRSSCHSNNSNHHSINSSNYKDYITNYCSKISSYNHSCHPECSRKSNEQDSKHEINSLSSLGKKSRSHTSSPMQISNSPPAVAKQPQQQQQQSASNSIVVTAETHQQQPQTETINKSKSNLNDLGEIVNTKDDPQPLEKQIIESSTIKNAAQFANQSQQSTSMDSNPFVEQLHQFQQQYLKEHPEVNLKSTEDQLVRAECTNNDPNNNQQQRQQQTFSGIVGTYMMTLI